MVLKWIVSIQKDMNCCVVVVRRRSRDASHTFPISGSMAWTWWTASTTHQRRFSVWSSSWTPRSCHSTGLGTSAITCSPSAMTCRSVLSQPLSVISPLSQPLSVITNLSQPLCYQSSASPSLLSLISASPSVISHLSQPLSVITNLSQPLCY